MNIVIVFFFPPLILIIRRAKILNNQSLKINFFHVISIKILNEEVRITLFLLWSIKNNINKELPFL